MKKTRMLVVTAAIILGLGSSVHAELPSNSIMVGSNVYSSGYLSNPNNLAKVNDQLMNNLGSIYFVDSSGKAKDVFTGSIVEDSELVSKFGNSLTYYNNSGVIQKIVADANNKYTKPSSVNSDTYAILNVKYKPTVSTLTMYSVKVTQIAGISNAAYFKIGDSAITPLTDMATYIGGPTTTGNLISIYASNGITELASGYADIKTDNIGGEQNVSVILTPMSSENPVDKTTHGNTAVNISNTGFAAIDKDGKWIYYQNTGDKKKLYRKSVTGVEDYVISDDSVGFINVVGDWVYYTNYNDKGKIYKVRTDGTQRQIVSDDMASCVNVVGDKIYYINNSDRGRIYIIDSQGRRQLIPASAKFLSVGDNFLFYVNTSDGNKLYSYDLLSNRAPQKISDVNTAFINAAGDYLVFYTGKDGKLYRSTNGVGQTAIPMQLITNIPQKGGKGSSDLKGVADTATTICAIDDNNIYYKSYADGGKIYKLDNTGNGYKVVDAAVDYMNIVGDSLYFMKSGKVYVVPKDADGSVKGTAVAKPKLNEKVVTVEPIPMLTTDDITKFSFPQRVSCIMSDGTIRQLVVNWDNNIPKPSKGVYNFKGTILGYGNKVTMSVALDSGTLDVDAIEVTNEIGNKDTVKVDGLKAKGKLEPGDTVSVYNELSDLKPSKTATVDKNGNVIISGLNFNPDGGSIYVSITKKGNAEGGKVTVAVPAEAPAGFLVDAENENVTGLKPRKEYKVYINDLNADGSIPALPDNPFVTVTANDKGEITVNGMKTKIENNKPDNKQMLRLVAVGIKDSMPSAPIEISKAKVPDYVSIDLNLGRIVGTSAQMQYRYKDTEEWKDCQPGTTPISMTLSLEVQVKVKASGPVMGSDVKKFGLFPMPVVTGIENGKIYSTREDSTGKSDFPEVSWSTSNVEPGKEGICYTATLKKKDGTVLDNNVTPSTLVTVLKKTGNGDYVLTVTGTKTDNSMTPSTATNSVTINFTINSAAPSKPDITMMEKAGTKKLNDKNELVDIDPTNDVLTYYQATPMWTELAGSYTTATIKMTKTASGTPGNITYTDVKNPAEIAFARGNTISQSGEYEFKVITTSKENGAKSEIIKKFRVDSINQAVAPNVAGVNEGGVYNDVKYKKTIDGKETEVGITIKDMPNCATKTTIMREGYVTDYTNTTEAGKELSGGALTVNGKYVLIINTTNVINGHLLENKKISFTIDAAEQISPNINADKVEINNNPSGEDEIIINDDIQYGTIIKVYSASGSVIGTTSYVNGIPTVKIPAGIPANDEFIYITRTETGKQESNKVKVVVTKVPSVKSVSPKVFTETPSNDGTISGINSDGTSTNMIVVEIENGKISNDIKKEHVTANNLPTGLDYTVQKLDDTHLGIEFTEKATSHTNANDTDEVSFEILGEQVGGKVGENLNTGNITIDFNDPVKLIASPTILKEAASNDGTVTEDIIVEVKNGILTNPSITDTNTDSTGYVSATNLPEGLHYKIEKIDDTHLKISISGQAKNHANANDANVTFTVKKEKITGAESDTTTSIDIDFRDQSVITYSSDSFEEASSNNGTIGNSITITVIGNTFADNVGQEFISKGYVTVSNVPSGLIPKVIKTGDNTLTFKLEGSKIEHGISSSIDNLTIEFKSNAFGNTLESDIKDSTKTNLKVTFREE